VLKCRPPGNRDPRPDEIDACRGFLEEQVALIRPSVVCTLGNFATKLLSGSPEGISKVHGQPQPAEFAGVPVTLYPVYHPAAALYTRAMLGSLEDDFGRLAELLGVGTAAAGSSALAEADAARPDAPRSADDPASRQLDLF
jgi:DNA polymerase